MSQSSKTEEAILAQECVFYQVCRYFFDPVLFESGRGKSVC